MATEITWNINTLERETEDGFVYTAHYVIDAKDDTYAAGAYGSIGFERPEELIPYSEITKETAIEWVKVALGEEKITQIEETLENQLQEQRSPSKAAGVPW